MYREYVSAGTSTFRYNGYNNNILTRILISNTSRDFSIAMECILWNKCTLRYT